MSMQRMPADVRRKAIKLAISRIERGRTHTRAEKLNISTVAKEAGVTPALIHNHYPDIAEEIREKQGRTSRAQRDAKHSELLTEREKNRTLRAELSELRAQVAKLASINEVLLIENRLLKAKQGDPKVADLPLKKK